MCLVTQSCPPLCNPMDCSPPGSSVHRDSPGKNSGVGCHAHLQGIFPTQGSNPGLPHCRQILYQLSHQGSLKRYVQVCLIKMAQKTFDYLSTVEWLGTSLMVQWLRLHIPNAGDMCSILAPVSKIPYATQQGPKKQKLERMNCRKCVS